MVLRGTLRKMLLLASVLAVAAPAALAHAGDGRPHVQPFQEIRQDRATVDATSMTHVLERATEPLNDFIRFSFDGPSATATYEYRPDAPDPRGGLTMSVAFIDVVEYRDTNGNGLYDPGIDPADARASFAGANWTIAPPRLGYIGSDSGNLTAASARIGNATFTVEAYANGRQDVFRQTGLHPQDVKMNWKIKGWPLEFPESRLALHATVAWSSGLSEHVVNDADGMANTTSFTRPGLVGFLTWADRASEGDAAATQIPRPETIAVRLGATFDAGDMAMQTVEFDYPGAGYIIHDPTFGVEYAPPGRPALLGLPAPLVVGVAVVAVVGAAGLVAWRKWKRVET